MKTLPYPPCDPNPVVRIMRTGPRFEDPNEVETIVSLKNGHVDSTNPDWLDRWEKRGIVGRHMYGRLYPEDGAAFVNELLHAYSGSRCWAEKVNQHPLDRNVLGR